MKYFTTWSILFVQLCTIGAMGAAYLANAWMVEGLGLNPWVALPCATLLMLAPFTVRRK